MQLVFFVLAQLVKLYLFVLIARLVIDWIQIFARDWRPKGFLLVILEGIYSLTDPPLRFLRRFIPPIRLGSVALDLSFIVLFLALSLLDYLLTSLSRAPMPALG